MTVWQKRAAIQKKFGHIISDQVYDEYKSIYGEIFGKFKGQKVKWTWSTRTWFYTGDD